MPDVPRSHLLAYAIGAILVVVLGVWTLGDRGAPDTGGPSASFADTTGSEDAAESSGSTGTDDRSDGGSGAAPDGSSGAAPDGGSGAAPDDQQPSVGTAAPTAVVVYVAGAVRHAGVYRLTDGDRVEDAVRRAGGTSARADLTAINLAAKLADGQQIVVPSKVAGGGSAAGGTAAAGSATGGPAAGSGDGAAGSGAVGQPISLNSATEEQLETLDGVGPATAQKIIAWRTANGGFRSIDDLTQVSGIGPKKLEALRPHVQP